MRAAAGVDGVLVVDYPPEECERLRATAAGAAHLDPIFLLAPTSTEARIAHVGRIASGYVYYVSLKGVTGAGHLDIARGRCRWCRASSSACAAAGRRRLRHPRRARPRARWPPSSGRGRDRHRALVQLLEIRRTRDNVAAAPRAFIAEIRAALDSYERKLTSMSWLEKLLPPKIQPNDRERAPHGAGRPVDQVPIAARRCCTRPISSRTSTSARSAATTTASARAHGSTPSSMPEGRYEIGQEVLAGRRAEVQGQQEVHRAAEGRAREHRRDRCAGRDGRRADEHAAGRGVLRVRLHGRLDGLGRRRALRARRRHRRSSRRRRSSASPPPAARACRRACSA